MPRILVKGADQMITSVNRVDTGIECTFADGCSGMVPFVALRGFDPTQLMEIELTDPRVVVLHMKTGTTEELPWDFIRHYCDQTYQARAEGLAVEGYKIFGKRLKRLREVAKLTQEQLAVAAGIARVTLIRLENGEQSPRYETLEALARALRRPFSDLVEG